MLRKLLTKLGIHLWKEEYRLLDLEEIEEDEQRYLSRGEDGISVKYVQFKYKKELTVTPNCFLHNHISHLSNLSMYKKVRICKICGKIQELKENDWRSSSYFTNGLNDYWGDIVPTKSDERNKKLEELLS